MANSDNVLRGGLTPKHIDVPELMRVLRFDPAAPRIIVPQAADKTVSLYAVDVAEFALAQIELAGEQVFFSSAKRGMEILLTVEGAVSIYPGGAKTKFALRKGASVMVPACLAGYSIQGEGKVFRASIPLPTD
jgi:mannose-6-phosphate isomerase